MYPITSLAQVRPQRPLLTRLLAPLPSCHARTWEMLDSSLPSGFFLAPPLLSDLEMLVGEGGGGCLTLSPQPS